MSTHETPMTEGFWESTVHGLFIAEYPLVERGVDRAPRYVDGLILPDEPHGRDKWRDHASLSGRRVVVIVWGIPDGPSALFRTLGARTRCIVSSINFVVS